MPKRARVFQLNMATMWIAFGMLAIRWNAPTGRAWGAVGALALVLVVAQVVATTYSAWAELHATWSAQEGVDAPPPSLQPWQVAALMVVPGVAGIGWFVGALLWVQQANRLRTTLPNPPERVRPIAAWTALVCLALSAMIWPLIPAFGLGLALLSSAAWVEVVTDMLTWKTRSAMPSATERWASLFGWVDGRLRPELVAAAIAIQVVVLSVTSAVQDLVIENQYGRWSMLDVPGAMLADPMRLFYTVIGATLVFGVTAAWVAFRGRANWLSMLAVMVVVTLAWRLAFLVDAESMQDVVRRLIWSGSRGIDTVLGWGGLLLALRWFRGGAVAWVAVFAALSTVYTPLLDYAQRVAEFVVGFGRGDSFPETWLGMYSYEVYAPWLIATLVIAMLLSVVHRSVASPFASQSLRNE